MAAWCWGSGPQHHSWCRSEGCRSRKVVALLGSPWDTFSSPTVPGAVGSLTLNPNPNPPGILCYCWDPHLQRWPPLTQGSVNSAEALPWCPCNAFSSSILPGAPGSVAPWNPNTNLPPSLGLQCPSPSTALIWKLWRQQCCGHTSVCENTHTHTHLQAFL